LLDRLVTEKLKAEAETIAAEGWKWISVAVDFPYGHTQGLRQIEGKPVDLSPEEQATIDALNAEQAKLEVDYRDADELPDEVDQRLGEIESALAAFEDRPMLYEPAEIARAGVFISIDSEGRLAVDRGDVHARSPKGAMGLMQIMPATWAELRVRYNLGNDPYDPHDNILAGTAYLRELLDRYGSPGVFAAYNAGPSRYEEHLAGGSLPDETRAYVAKLANLLAVELPPRWTSGGQSSAAATLFVTRSDLMKTRDRLLALMPSSGVTTAFSAPDVSPMVPRPIGMFVPRSDSGVSR
jgi:hypothetical protein